MVLNENDMFNIVFETIQENPGEKVAMVLMKKVCNTIVKKNNGIIDTQEICDDVLKSFDYYNDFIEEKKINLPVIGDTYYNLVVVILNALIGEIFYEDTE